MAKSKGDMGAYCASAILDRALDYCECSGQPASSQRLLPTLISLTTHVHTETLSIRNSINSDTSVATKTQICRVEV